MNLGHRLNLLVTKDYHKLWFIIIIIKFINLNVEIHILEEEVVLILCS
jgi:hypothetical protein